jgi:Protein of unknown function (DUF3105)
VRHLLLLLLTLALLVAACGGPDPTPAATAPAETTAPVAQSPSPAPGCGAVALQADQGNVHVIDINQAYTQHPATSGPHYPVPLPPQPSVYTTPVPEARAVHNLEHGYVWVYYRDSGAAALSAGAIDALRTAATAQRKVLMAPYPQLPDGVTLAFAAWDELQQCGSGVTATQAVASLGSFVNTYREGPLAPEPGAG